MLAAKVGHLNVVKKLITNGARLDITDKVNSLSTTGIHCTQVASFPGPARVRRLQYEIRAEGLGSFIT